MALVSDELPTVSVIIPARNAGEALRDALDSIARQTYPNVIEAIVAAADPETAAAASGAVVVDNPSGTTPAGLNRAFEKSTGDVIVRCDAHARLPEGYIERAVETLLRSGADNVGGMQVPVGETFWERAIAAAMSSPLGAGDARYRLGGDEGPVETVYLGVYRREALERLGGFDEEFTRTQDYELNHRIIASGGTVWFDPELRVEYRPRGSLSALARQYYEYGRAKRLFARRHPGSLRWRQLVPPAAVAALGASLVISVWWPWAFVALGVYALAVTIAGLATAPREGMAAFGSIPALAVMHLSWGLGFLKR